MKKKDHSLLSSVTSSTGYVLLHRSCNFLHFGLTFWQLVWDGNSLCKWSRAKMYKDSEIFSSFIIFHYLSAVSDIICKKYLWTCLNMFHLHNSRSKKSKRKNILYFEVSHLLLVMCFYMNLAIFYNLVWPFDSLFGTVILCTNDQGLKYTKIQKYFFLS